MCVVSAMCIAIVYSALGTILKDEAIMEIKLERPLKVATVKSVDKLMILVYNLILVTGACYLVYYKDASAWLFVLAMVFGASWKLEKENVNV